MKKIRCDLCGYEFKTIEKLETKYDCDSWCDYEEYVTYPDPEDSNQAHLVRNYICDKCYQNIGNIIRNNLIEQGKSFVKNLPSRIEEKRKELELEIKKLEEESEEVNEICKKLNNINYLFELSIEELKSIEKYEYHPFEIYYLDRAIKIEREKVKREFSIDEWSKMFEIKVVKLPNKINSSDIVDIDTFKNLLKECVLEGCSYKDMNRLLKKINTYIANT